MKEQFSQSECETIMEKLMEKHCVKKVTMYQLRDEPAILICKVPSTSNGELETLKELNVTTTIFAEGRDVELWITKN